MQKFTGTEPVFTRNVMQSLARLVGEEKDRRPDDIVSLKYRSLWQMKNTNCHIEQGGTMPFIERNRFVYTHQEPFNAVLYATMKKNWDKHFDKWYESSVERAIVINWAFENRFLSCPDIDRIICIGLGTMKDNSEASYYQHFAVKAMALEAQRVHHRVRVVFQDPVYTEEDEKLIEYELGDGIRNIINPSIMDDPGAFLYADYRALVVTFRPGFPVREVIENQGRLTPAFRPAAILCAPPGVSEVPEDGDHTSPYVSDLLTGLYDHYPPKAPVGEDLVVTDSHFGNTWLFTRKRLFA